MRKHQHRSSDQGGPDVPAWEIERVGTHQQQGNEARNRRQERRETAMSSPSSRERHRDHQRSEDCERQLEVVAAPPSASARNGGHDRATAAVDGAEAGGGDPEPVGAPVAGSRLCASVAALSTSW